MGAKRRHREAAWSRRQRRRSRAAGGACGGRAREGGDVGEDARWRVCTKSMGQVELRVAPRGGEVRLRDVAAGRGKRQKRVRSVRVRLWAGRCGEWGRHSGWDGRECERETGGMDLVLFYVSGTVAPAPPPPRGSPGTHRESPGRVGLIWGELPRVGT